jgi:hypothetical protein
MIIGGGADMFHESYTIPPEPSPLGGMALRCVWDIHADHTYDVAVDTARRASVQLRSDGGTGLIAYDSVPACLIILINHTIFTCNVPRATAKSGF